MCRVDELGGCLCVNSATIVVYLLSFSNNMKQLCIGKFNVFIFIVQWMKLPGPCAVLSVRRIIIVVHYNDSSKHV